MKRVTFKLLKEWINEWNEYNDIQMEVRAYNDYYHIGPVGGNYIIVEKTPGRAWEVFCIWKNGYFTGRDSK